MHPVKAWTLLGAATAATVVAIMGPWQASLALAGASLALSRHRIGLLTFLLLALAFQSVFLGFGSPSGAVWWEWWRFQVSDGSLRAAGTASLRLAALVGIPSALADRVPPAQMLDGLRLPPRYTAPIAAIWLAVQDIQEDWRRLVATRRALGLPGGARRDVAALPHLMQRALLSGRTRQEALRMAGMETGPTFAPIIAFSALAAAGRMATVAIPNVAPTYLIVFVAGWWGGPRIGAATGALSMFVTDLLLSGFAPAGLVNVPAMAGIGLLGAGMAHVSMEGEGTASRSAMLGSVGFLATLAFSLTADATAWLLPEFRDSTPALLARIVAGLLFSVPAAIANAVLFAIAVPSAARAARVLPWREAIEG